MTGTQRQAGLARLSAVVLREVCVQELRGVGTSFVVGLGFGGKVLGLFLLFAEWKWTREKEVNALCEPRTFPWRSTSLLLGRGPFGPKKV